MAYVIEDVARMTQRKQYPDSNHPAVKERMLPLPVYTDLARRMIGAFAPAAHKGMLLNNEDAIGYVAFKIMRGDWDYKPNYKTKSGKSVALNTYRGCCAKWAIAEYIRSWQTMEHPITIETDDGTVIETNVHHPLPLDMSRNANHHSTLGDSVEDGVGAPLDDMIDDEERNEKRRAVRNILGGLSKPQRECIILYYVHGLTSQEIATRLNVSRQAVQQNISRGMKAMKKAVGAK